MRTRALVRVLVAAALVAVALIGWYVPAGPSVLASGVGFSLRDAYAGNHYIKWPAVSAQERFKITSVNLRVDDPSTCTAEVRLLKAPPGTFDVVQTGPMPGESAVGAWIDYSSSMNFAIVLTPSHPGDCGVTSVTVGTRSWGRERTTTVNVGFNLSVSHATGTDPRGPKLNWKL